MNKIKKINLGQYDKNKYFLSPNSNMIQSIYDKINPSSW